MTSGGSRGNRTGCLLCGELTDYHDWIYDTPNDRVFCVCKEHAKLSAKEIGELIK